MLKAFIVHRVEKKRFQYYRRCAESFNQRRFANYLNRGEKESFGVQPPYLAEKKISKENYVFIDTQKFTHPIEL